MEGPKKPSTGNIPPTKPDWDEFTSQDIKTEKISSEWQHRENAAIKSKPLIVILSETPYYQIFFTQKFRDLYEIKTLASSSISLKEIISLAPMMILIDDAFFGEDLFLLLRSLRSKRTLHTCYILVITRKLKKAYFDQLIHSGANDILKEPLEEKDILERFDDAKRRILTASKLDNIVGNFVVEETSSRSLKNHFLLNKQALEPIHQSIKEGKMLSILLLAIDQGYTFIEELHSSILETIKLFLREKDLLFYLGRGKFVIIMNETHLKPAFFLGEKIKEAISKTPYMFKGTLLHYTSSIGICSQKTPPYEKIEEMIMEAKNALFRASAVGNQINVSHA